MNIDNNWKLKAHAIEDTVYPCLFIGSLRAPFMAVMISRNETLHYSAVVSTLLSLSLSTCVFIDVFSAGRGGWTMLLHVVELKNKLKHMVRVEEMYIL